MKIILTGATGMVGEGVLFECLENNAVKEVLMVNRKTYNMTHPKLKELIVKDFLKIEEVQNNLKGYDACFYCAGISSIGMKEKEYNTITYDTTLHFANVVLEKNPNMIFSFISGKSTDSSEQGKIMWARIKGKTENALKTLPFKSEYNFRPALMLKTDGQKNVKKSYLYLTNILKFIIPSQTISLSTLGKAMIASVSKGYPKNILEVKDIKILGKNI